MKQFFNPQLAFNLMDDGETISANRKCANMQLLDRDIVNRLGHETLEIEMLKDNFCSSKWPQSKACRDGMSTLQTTIETAIANRQHTIMNCTRMQKRLRSFLQQKFGPHLNN